jgi:hypothetical protein
VSAIKAIETRYAGCRFRSRLEARWAVFFDHLGIGWRYEPEGYCLSNGEFYLPDFFLQGAGVWVEVKGQLGFRDFKRLVRATVELPRRGSNLAAVNLLLLGEIPRTGGAFVHSGFVPVDSATVFHQAYFYNDNGGWIVQPIGDGSIFRADAVDHHEDSAEGEYASFLEAAPSAVPDLSLRADPRLKAAYTAALSARFEHGESG